MFIFTGSLLLHASMLLYKLTEFDGLSSNLVFLNLFPTFAYFSLSLRNSGSSKLISVPR